jgi:hypothetical protein
MPYSGVVSGILETSKSGTSAIYRNAFRNPGGESWRGIERERERERRGGIERGTKERERERESKRILFYDY